MVRIKVYCIGLDWMGVISVDERYKMRARAYGIPTRLQQGIGKGWRIGACILRSCYSHDYLHSISPFPLCPSCACFPT